MTKSATAKPISFLVVGLIRFYQYFISPLLGQNCRFYPSCSDYAKESVIAHGALKGIYLTLKRIIRCQPFCTGGYDPVPTEIRLIPQHRSICPKKLRPEKSCSKEKN